MYRDDVMMDRCCVQRMMSWRFTKFQEKTIWRFTKVQEDACKGIFEVLKIDMNKFKSIWGLMWRI